MHETNNPFKELEPDVYCPPDLKSELITEIDLMRNVLLTADMHVHNTFAAFTAFLDGLLPTEKTE